MAGKRTTHEEYVSKLAIINPNIEALDIYINSYTKIMHKCRVCGNEWKTMPKLLLRGCKCPKCALKNRPHKKIKTHEQYVKEVAKINKNIEVMEAYIEALTKILHQCKICNYQWKTKPASILRGHGCPNCAKMVAIDHNTYVMLLKECNENISVLEPYVNKETPIRHHCNIDGYEWSVSPSYLLKGYNCPVCAGVKIGNPPEYKNSIWSSEQKEYFSKFLTEEQMKTYMPNSNQKINIPCSDCGYVKNVRIADLLRYGFSCKKCGDGISYPNKFGRAFVDQLPVDNIVYEYSPEWLVVNGNKCFYDIYFEYDYRSYIIEMDGGLGHGNRAFNNNNVDTEGLHRDSEKDKLASLHSINVIRIDTKKSNKEYLKKSIMDSCLPNILKFKEDDINWEKCDEFATSKFIFMASDLWKSGVSISEIAKVLKININTVTHYLKIANNLNICNYTKEESQRRAGALRSKTKRKIIRKVIRLKDKIIYDSIKDAYTINNVHESTMYKYCKNKKKFMYYDEWLFMLEENEKEG